MGYREREISLEQAHKATSRLAARKERPTIEELQEVSNMYKQVPGIGFEESFERARATNSPDYQEVARKTH